MRSIQRQSFFSLIVPIFLLALLLAACGSQGGTGNTGSTGSSGKPNATPTAATDNSTTSGCPNPSTVSNEPAKASVLITPANSKETITAHNGDVIEIQLPFGHKWSGPTTSQGTLQLQGPAGYASQSNKMCVWRYVATGTGTTELNFSSRAICKTGELCPMYVLNLPFTITVK